MQQLLYDKIIAVTGGFGVLGRALADALRDVGAQVALLDRTAPPADLSTDILALGGIDLGGPTAAFAAMTQVAARFGGLDGLVNVAGGFSWEAVENGSVETWDHLYMTNVRTALLTSQAALPHLLLRGSGRIVNVGALCAGQANFGMGAYAASKAGVARLTEAMAEEFKDRGLTVNCVLPSILDTPANRAERPRAEFSRWVAPGALAKVIVFLLSDAAGPINGALIPVKGRV